jgi:hypothetical protein
MQGSKTAIVEKGQIKNPHNWRVLIISCFFTIVYMISKY